MADTDYISVRRLRTFLAQMKQWVLGFTANRNTQAMSDVTKDTGISGTVAIGKSITIHTASGAQTANVMNADMIVDEKPTTNKDLASKAPTINLVDSMVMEAVSDAFDDITTIEYQSVNNVGKLPQVGQAGVIYLCSVWEEVENPTGNPHDLGYYVYTNGEYVLTTDTSVQSGTTYYTKAMATDEYIWLASESRYEPLGQAKVDLTGLLFAGSATSGGTAYKAAAIPFGRVDSTSTSTKFTASVEGITALEDGVCCYLTNDVVTSASGFTLNINGLGAKPVYTNLADATRDTTIFNKAYTMLFVYNSTRVSGGCWDCYRGYDSNTNTIGYQLRTNNGILKTTDAFRYYKVLFTSADNTHWVPSSVDSTNNATSARAVNQRPINPFGPIVYCHSTSAFAANADVTAAAIWQQYAITLGYSFNRTGAALALTTKAPVYIKCTPQSDGSAIIDADSPYVQTLPTTEDGKIYIYFGIAYSATAVELRMEHPVYYFKDGEIRLWTNQAAAEVEIKKYNSDKTDESEGTADYGQTDVFINGDVSTIVTTQAPPSAVRQYIAPSWRAINQKLAEKADADAIPTKTSDLTNDSGYVKHTDETYEGHSGSWSGTATVENVGMHLSSITFTIPNGQGIKATGTNTYPLYIINSSKTKILATSTTNGTVSWANLTGESVTVYVAIDDDDRSSTFDFELFNVGFDSAIEGLQEQIGGKQDTISDLATIRSGASKGATAIQPTDIKDELDPGGNGEIADSAAIAEYVGGITSNLVQSVEITQTASGNDPGTTITIDGGTPHSIVKDNEPGGSSNASVAPSWGAMKEAISDVNDVVADKVDKVTSTDNAVVRFNGTGGAIQNSGVTINDSNHVTAAKFKTSGGTSSQVVKGNGDLQNAAELPQYEAYLEWGGKNFAAAYGPIDAAMVAELGAPRTMFAKAAGIVVEYSTDGGNTWLDYGATDVQKVGLFSSSQAFYTGKNSTAGGGSVNNMLRVSLRTGAASIYTTLNKFVIYVGTNGSTGCYCTIRCRTQQNYEDNVDTWVTRADQVPINGWSGYNVINITSTTTYGNTKSSQYGEWQFIFGCTNFSGNYTGLVVNKIIGFGGVGWTTPSNMAKTGHIYAFDASQNATFPAQVQAASFKKTGGTSSQFLKADGSVDSTAYGTYSKPSGGIPKTDLASAVQTSLDKADTALQSHQDISGKVDYADGTKTTTTKQMGTTAVTVDGISMYTSESTTYTIQNGYTISIDAQGTSMGYIYQNSNSTILAQDPSGDVEWTNTTGESVVVKIGSATSGENYSIAIFKKGYYSTIEELTEKIEEAAASGVQADWNEDDSTDPAYIKNKPTVYTKPLSGIPKGDLANAVQTSLGKADSAVQSVTITQSSEVGTGGTTIQVDNGNAYQIVSDGEPQGSDSGYVAPTWGAMKTLLGGKVDSVELVKHKTDESDESYDTCQTDLFVDDISLGTIVATAKPVTSQRPYVAPSWQGFEEKLSEKSDKSNTYTKSEVNGLVSGINNNPIIGERPTTGQLQNRIYRVPGTNSYTDWAWDGSDWVKLAEFSGSIFMQITEAEYDALSDSEKNNGTWYFIEEE